MDQELLVYILPVFLFILSIIITFIITATLRTGNKIKKLREATDLYKTELDKHRETLRLQADELDRRQMAQLEAAKELLESLDNRLREVRAYHDDLVDMQAAMTTFHGALANLAKETEFVEKKAGEVLEASSGLAGLKTLLAEFSTRLDDVDNAIALISKKVEVVGSTVLLDFQEQAQEKTCMQLEKLDDAFNRASALLVADNGEPKTEDVEKAIPIGSRLFGAVGTEDENSFD